MSFVHLHVHSEYSLLDSVCRLPELVSQAKTLGYQALAITDENALYGVLPFYRLCRQAGIKPIIGMQVHSTPINGKRLSIILLAKNETGYKQLVALSTRIQQSEYKAVDIKELNLYTENLIALVSGNKENFADWLLEDARSQLISVLKFLKSNSPSELYLEIQDHGKQAEKEAFKHLVKLSREIGIPLAATNNVHYLTKDQAESHKVLNAIRDGKKQDPYLTTDLNRNYYLTSPEEMIEIFKAIPEAVENTQKIADLCDLSFSFNTFRLPSYPIPDRFDTQGYLRYLTEKGMQERYVELSDEMKKRVDHELDIIHNMGFDDYFLIVWDIIHYAKKNGIKPGPGRGSAAGSIVCYCLGIIDVDPIKHQLLFERFLNPERVSMPDIDIDFPDVSRDVMIHYVCERYGKDHAAQIITFGTLAAKAAVRDVGRVLDCPSALIDKLAKGLSSRSSAGLKKAIQESSTLKQLIRSTPELKKLIDIAIEVEGLPRHTSIHAAGIVISEGPLTEVVPLQEGRDDIPLTQYPMEELEALGLLKMDFLGLRNLSLIEDILKDIDKSEHKKINLDNIPEDDPATFNLLGSGDTTGVFQLESSGMRDVVKKLQPTAFEDIVAVNALFRPGPMQNIPIYIQGKHHPEKVVFPHDDLKPILSKTYGVIVYQEQIMQIASKMAGFTMAQADILRRAVSKKKRDVLEENQKAFVKGCIRKGYDEKTAITIYQLIVRFADFGFNRSHAVAYSFISYRLAYLKTHYPAPFMTALLSSLIHHTDKMAELIMAGRNKGITFLPPSVNRSSHMFTSEDKKIRFGLGAIKNVGRQAVNEIVQAREKGPFKNLADFCERISLRKVNRRAIESLILAGALDEFNDNRAVLLATLDRLFRHFEKQGSSHYEQIQLLENEYEDFMVSVPPLSLADQMKFEKEAIGFYLSQHPVHLFIPRLKGYQYQSIANLKADNHKVGRVAVFVDTCRQIKTKKGQLMAFLTVSDPSGQEEMIAFPTVYENNRGMLQEGGLIFAEVSMSEKNNSQQWIIQKVTELSALPPKKEASKTKGRRVFVKIDTHHDRQNTLYQLKQALGQYHGTAQVMLYYESTGKTLALPDSYNVEPSNEFVNVIERLIGNGNVIIKEG